MICGRCFQDATQGDHGLGLCPYEPRPVQYGVRQDSIEGGLWIAHGLCNPDGSPRRYDSRSEITRECAKRGLVRWTDGYEERATKEGRERADWMRSGEFQRLRADRREQRMERARR